MRFPRGMDYAGPVGDLDGDGCDDVALSSGSWLIDQGFQHNDYIASGRTGERLITIDTTRDSFVAYRGDILGPIENGLVETVGPYTLTLRKARPAGLSFVQVHLVEVGMNIGNVSVGDFDGDRHLDVINPRCDLWSGRKASVRLYSSRTQLMREIPNPSPDVSLPTPVGGSEPVSAFAYAATLIPDMNGDGLVEFAISDPEVFRRGVGWYENSRLQRYWSWESFQGFACSGVNLELIPDRDGDGLADLLIASGDWQMVDWVPEIDGNLAIVSTRTGATVASIEEVAINPTLDVPVSVR